MRIMIVSTTYHPAANGQAIFTTNLAEGLLKRGHEILVVTQSNRAGKPYEFTHNGVEVRALASTSLRQWYSDVYITLFANKALRQLVEQFHPDIVHIQDHYPISQAAFHAANRQGIRTIGTNHFMPDNLAPHLKFLSKFRLAFNWVLWRWMLSVFQRLDVATAPSKTAAAILRSKGLETPVSPVSCGVDLQRFSTNSTPDRGLVRERYKLSPTKLLLLFVGRVDLEKRLDVIIFALKKLQRPDIQFAVVGHGMASDSLREMVASLEMQEQVVFTGYVPDDDLLALLNTADVFVMPSEAELLSIATLEAMACARPILAANALALPELVASGTNGYLFESGDSEDAARKITKLAENRQDLAHMGTASLVMVRAHSLSKTISRYEELYEAVLLGIKLPATRRQRSLTRQIGERIIDAFAELWP